MTCFVATLDVRYLPVDRIWNAASNRSSTANSVQLTSLRCHGWEPVGRAYHAACVIGKKMYVHGGFDGRRARADLLVLDLGTSLLFFCNSLLI
jgi:hypothetical protein